jgi:hypothetical protein
MMMEGVLLIWGLLNNGQLLIYIAVLTYRYISFVRDLVGIAGALVKCARAL